MTVKLPGTCESCRWSTIRRDDPHVVEQFGYICEIPECRNRVVVHSWTCCSHYEAKPVTLEEAMAMLRDWWGWAHGPNRDEPMFELHRRRDALLSRYNAIKEE